MLRMAIEDFIDIYEEVLNALSQLPPATVLQISGEEFRNWSMEHSRRNGENQFRGGNSHGYGNRNRYGFRNGYDKRSRDWNGYRENGRLEIHTGSGNISVYVGNNYMQCNIPFDPDEKMPGPIVIQSSGNEVHPAGPLFNQDPAAPHKKHKHRKRKRTDVPNGKAGDPVRADKPGAEST